ncbi:NACHT domain-containing protein [Micromonospora sp. LOL_015]|uniref:NACHT domain-containing protein n=1 Tax=Micromonospora sp. LOL_015 TaxID=3345416 RepID=UPI003A8C7990
MGLLEAAAVKLGETLVNSVFASLTGNKAVGDAAGGLAGVLGGQAGEVLDRRRARRRLDDVADAVAGRVCAQYEHEFRGLSEEERAVVVEAVAETFQLAPLDPGLVLAADLRPGSLEDRVRSGAAEYLAVRFFGRDEADLYDLLLASCCAEVVVIVRAMAGLADLAVPEILQRLTQLAVDVREAPRRAVVDASRDADAAFAEIYRAHVGPGLDIVDLDSARLSAGSRQYPLSLAYLSLPAAVSNATEPAVPTRVESALAGRSRVLIRARCGAGKTTFLYRLFMLAARRAFTGELAAFNDALPFYLPLHRFAEAEMPSPDHLLDAVARDISGEMPHGWVQRQLRDGNSLVLINGIDEVPDDRRPAMLDWLAKLVVAFSRARYVVTSRPGVIPVEWPSTAGFDVVDLLPMSPSDMWTFIRRWHEAVGSGQVTEEARAEVNRCADRLLEALAASGALRALAANPLVCALMCALHRDGRVQLPTGWLDLVGMVVEILIEERDRERGVADGLAPPIEQSVGILQDLAYWMVTEDLAVAGAAVVRDRVRHRLGPANEVSPGGRAEALVDHLAVRSGLIQLCGNGAVTFTDAVFRDYLAAREVAAGGNIRSLVRDAHVIGRQRLVVMAAGHARLPQAEELLSGLLVRVGERTDAATALRLQVLAMLCLGAVSGLGPELRRRVEEDCAITIPCSAEEARLLAEAGPLVVDLLAERTTDRVTDALGVVLTAADLGGNDVLPLLRRLALDGRAEVAAALRAVTPRFDADEYERMVLSCCPDEPAAPESRALGGAGGGRRG